MKDVARKELPAVSGGIGKMPGPFTEPVFPPPPVADYPQNPVVPTGPEGDGPGCG